MNEKFSTEKATILRIAAKLFVADTDGNILLLKRSGTHPRYPHQWDIPGGFVDEGDDDYVAALKRELNEETQLRLDAKKTELRYAQTDFYEKGSSMDNPESVVRLYFVGRLAVIGVAPPITLSWEHEDSLWAPVPELSTLLAGTPFEQPANYMITHNLL